MRVLFTINPGTSIFLYMVPLAWALRTAGHEVRVASQNSFNEPITQAGLTAVPVGRNADMFRLMEAAGVDQAMLEAARAGLGEPYGVIEDPENTTWEQILEAFVEDDAYKYENFPIIADLVRFARDWRPDLVIWEPFTQAGPVVAKACGAAHARLLWSVDVFGLARELFLKLKHQQPPEDQADPVGEWLGSYARKYGAEFSEDMVTGHFTIDQFPRSLQMEADLDYVRMQYVPYGGPAVVPKWLWAKPERPRVAITMGITSTLLFNGFTFDLQGVLDSLADLDIEVVATVSDAVREQLARIPDNARLLPYVPLHALAPTCSAVINHAGAATLATIARYGVPQLLLPYHFDEPILARKVAEQGAGLEMSVDAVTGASVRAAVLRLLTEPAFREGAARLRDEMRALPTPNELVPQLEELAAKYREA